MNSKSSSSFATAKLPTPLLNTPHFREVFGGSDGASLPLDEQGLLRQVEAVALPGTKFEILQRCDDQIVRVRTADYPSEKLFVDQRFLLPADVTTPERRSALPTKAQIFAQMKSLLGTSYVWGGNWPGIPQMLELYPPKGPLNETARKIWSFQGVDCSGLLYFATDGYTPRNTSELMTFGKSLPLAGKQPDEIVKLAEPLDLIVWPGHVVIVLSKTETIESFRGKGVIICDLKLRLEEICREPKNFVVNRWFFGS